MERTDGSVGSSQHSVRQQTLLAVYQPCFRSVWTSYFSMSRKHFVLVWKTEFAVLLESKNEWKLPDGPPDACTGVLSAQMKCHSHLSSSTKIINSPEK